MLDILQQIRDLQFKDKSGAEALLLSFLRDNTPFDVVHVQLTPLAISLNSFNGFMTLSDKRRFFFKSHTETDTIINEYYNASLLSDAGYPIIQPIHSSTEAGKQLLIYEVIDDQSVFDVAWELETAPNTKLQLLESLTQAQNKADDELLAIYLATETYETEEKIEKSPVHQLFYHRLTGGRLARFYGNENLQSSHYPEVKLPHATISMKILRQVQWSINGQNYLQTLEDIINQAIDCLNPHQPDWSVIGHGDAHNGNVFFRKQATSPSMLYFDPAFAGRHSALLDLAKPLFHNVFAMWMYYPHVIHQKLKIQIEATTSGYHIHHNYDLPRHRQMFFESKIEHTLKPYLQHLHQNQQLRADWRIYLKSALFCCPFLTMNLADGDRFPPEISLLGFAMAVEMGAESHGNRSYLDIALDKIEASLI